MGILAAAPPAAQRVHVKPLDTKGPIQACPWLGQGTSDGRLPLLVWTAPTASNVPGIGIEACGASHHRPGKISREGDQSLRRLLALGATAVIQKAQRGHATPWLLGLLARKPKKLAAVALANKMARIIRAMMVSRETYRRPQQT
jgi:hypothetical protein